MEIRMKTGNLRLPDKGVRWAAAGVISLLLFFLVQLGENILQDNLYDQQEASRWSSAGDAAQISCFFPQNAIEDINVFLETEQKIDTALQEASLEAQNEEARLWMDAISQEGEVTLTSDRASVTVKAMGVKNDFFSFHPLDLVTGSFFNQDSMMQDGVVIDEETAWQLFGSSDVAGMEFTIGQVPHYITGVISRKTGRMAEAAGLDQSFCYLSLDSLRDYGTVEGGICYEAVLPNPIDGFAASTITTAVDLENLNGVLVENSKRYSLLSLGQVILDFGTRSMSDSGIIYPYWENLARGYEDIFGLTLLVKIILLILPCILVLALIIYLWKKKTWTAGTAMAKLSEKIYDRQVQARRKKEEAAARKHNDSDTGGEE
jgi:hypothetical protein